MEKENGMKIDCGGGKTVGEALREQKALFTPCGGRGICGKCKVRTLGGSWAPPTEEEKRLLSEEELAQGVRLACQARGRGICEAEVLWIPGEMHILGAGEERAFDLLREDMRGKYGFAADLGTTTAVVQVWGPEGALLGEAAGPNPQQRFGGDVISRVQSALQGHAEELRRLAAGCLKGLLEKACRKAGVSPASLAEGVVVGNTAMLTLLAGVSPRGLSAFPFEPEEYFGRWYSGEELGLCGGDSRVYLPRCAASYVGADAVAAVVAAGLDRPGPVRLLADIGTNGEMFLAAEGRLLCCSTAAGPAFEGGGISCGMPGTDGAISRVFLREGKVVWESLGGGAPAGVCGSGLLDAAAAWKHLGFLDGTGLLLEGGEPVSRREIGDSGVCLTQKDIRNLQLAKSAIRAGMDTLLLRAGTKAEQVETLYLAGGFGTRLDPASAGAIGLIPPALAERSVAMGNGALRGAAAILLGRGMRERAREAAENAVHLELAADPDFMDCYMENMMF
ncbi:MAG: ASKHA domain-containing protein [Oscillospiraceae bacterium]|nr:ASKHA domain-containing protein [Oscillospiraceae bacterium]